MVVLMLKLFISLRNASEGKPLFRYLKGQEIFKL